VSISRRDQLCTSLSNRLGISDLCAQNVAFPFSNGFGGTGTNTTLAAQIAAFRIAGSVPSDGFGRGTEVPVGASIPTLFFRAASEMLCENVANTVVDVTNSRYQSADTTGAIADMVATVMGYPTSDPHHDQSITILTDHYTAAVNGSTSATNKTNALRSTFALACQSPSSLAFGI
jgi:hypothetical protein